MEWVHNISVLTFDSRMIILDDQARQQMTLHFQLSLQCNVSPITGFVRHTAVCLTKSRICHECNSQKGALILEIDNLQFQATSHSNTLYPPDSLMLGSPQSASSYHDAHYQQHSQSSYHHTTKEQTNCSYSAGVSVCRAVSFEFNWSKNGSNCANRKEELLLCI